MYKNNEFEYDLWTDTEGHCFARVKSSGEACEINKETMRLLRREEKRLQREKELKRLLTVDLKREEEIADERKRAAIMFPLSLSENKGEDDSREASWLSSYEKVEDRILLRKMIQDLMKSLSPQQLSVFQAILLEGFTYEEYSKQSGISKSRISVIVKIIRKKAKNLLERG